MKKDLADAVPNTKTAVYQGNLRETRNGKAQPVAFFIQVVNENDASPQQTRCLIAVSLKSSRLRPKECEILFASVSDLAAMFVFLNSSYPVLALYNHEEHHV